jgi:hypothetical protein
MNDTKPTPTWADVQAASEALNPVAEGLNPEDISDSDHLAAAAGMSNEGFAEYCVTYGERSAREVLEILRATPDVTDGVMYLASLVAAAHTAGVMAGVAATHAAYNDNKGK